MLILLFLLVQPVSSYWTSTPLAPWSTTTSTSLYGTSVDVGGTTVLISAPKEDVGTNHNAGAVHTFHSYDPSFSMRQRIVASDGEAGDEFGGAVSLSPDRLYLLIGAKHKYITDAGAAYLFYRTEENDDFIELTQLSITSGVAGDLFGADVTLSNDHAVVAAPGRSSSTGAVYVFLRSGVGGSSTWSLMSELSSGTSANNNQFGSSVSLFQSVLAVGVPGGDLTTPARENVGWVDVFILDKISQTWRRSATPMYAPLGQGEAYDYTGNDVAVGPGIILVAAHMDDHNSLDDVGSVHIYEYNATLSNIYEQGITETVTYRFEQTLTLIDTTPTELQNFTCSANDGSFRMSLGSARTEIIHWDDTLSTFRSKLLTLSSVSDVHVDIVNQDVPQETVCTFPNPHGITLTYHATSYGRGGDIPTLAYVPIDLDVVDNGGSVNVPEGTEAVVNVVVITHSNEPLDDLHQIYQGSKFGESLDISPNGVFAAVGATRSSGGVLGGKVNVYERNASAEFGHRWRRLHGMNVSSDQDTGGSPIHVQEAGHNFGAAVALDNSRLVVGAPFANINDMADIGMAYKYAMVPDPPTDLRAVAGTKKVMSIQWVVPLQNAARIEE
jgi:hypothetical protein